MQRKHRILLTTAGSLGDLHPFLGLALELKKRGHEPIIGAQEHRANVEAAGVEFRLIRSTLEQQTDPDLMRKALDAKNGSEFIVRTLMMPGLETAFEDTARAARDATLLVSHPMTLATRLVAETSGIPWASTQLAPIGFYSNLDPPLLSIPAWGPFRRPDAAVATLLHSRAKRTASSWTQPYRELRSRLGLGGCEDPLFEGSYSPLLVLGLFSGVLAPKQPDWPEQSIVTGFSFYDGTDATVDASLLRFLEAGEPPIIFTLGSSAVMDAGRFFEDSAEAAHRIGRRAILLAGNNRACHPASLPEGVSVFGYASFSALFPCAAAIVHQGGAGTMGFAMRAGRPMLVVPQSHDQPDNAFRAQRLGIARVLPRPEYSAASAAEALSSLLSDDQYVSRSRAAGEAVAEEDGPRTACDSLEALLRRVA